MIQSKRGIKSIETIVEDEVKSELAKGQARSR